MCLVSVLPNEGGDRLNTITAAFKPGSKRITTVDELTQYDYGQVLVITGISLPSPFEAHFSNTQFDGYSKPWIGMDNQVKIPDEYLESGEPIYVLIFLHYGENDGKTEYRITIPVTKRPRKVMIPIAPVEQGIIETTIAAINVAAQRAEDEADAAQAAKEAAEAEREGAEAAKEAIINMDAEADDVEADGETSVEKIVDEETGSIKLSFHIRRGRQGEQGEKGAVFTQAISSNGVISWTNNGELENPEQFNIVQAVLDAMPAAEEGRF